MKIALLLLVVLSGCLPEIRSDSTPAPTPEELREESIERITLQCSAILDTCKEWSAVLPKTPYDGVLCEELETFVERATCREVKEVRSPQSAECIVRHDACVELLRTLTETCLHRTTTTTDLTKVLRR